MEIQQNNIMEEPVTATPITMLPEAVEVLPDKVKEASETEDETEKAEEIIERPYTLRRLKEKDLFPMLQILRKIGIREFKNAFVQTAFKKDNIVEAVADKVKETFKEEKKAKDTGILVAFDIIDILLNNIGKVEDEVYALWADISGLSVDDIREMEFGTLPLMIMDTFSNVKDISFFKVLSKLL